MVEKDAFNPAVKKNPYADGFPIDYGKLDPHELSTSKPVTTPGLSRDIPVASEKNKPLTDGIHLCGLESYLQQCKEVNLGNIPLDKNGKPIAEVMPGKVSGDHNDPRYYIVINYHDNPLAQHKRYYFGPQLENILINGIKHPAADYRKAADDNDHMQMALHASEKQLRSSGIRLYDVNSGLNRIDMWAKNLATAAYPALKVAETGLRADVANYPTEPYSKIRLAQVLFAESFNAENAQRQMAIQQEARKLLVDAEKISRVHSTGSYDAGADIPTSTVGYAATPYFEDAVTPYTYWLGAQSQAAQCINQFDQFFHQANYSSYRSNALKSPNFYSKYPNSFSNSARPYGNFGQNLNPGYRNTFNPAQYSSGVPYINTGEDY